MCLIPFSTIYRVIAVVPLCVAVYWPVSPHGEDLVVTLMEQSLTQVSMPVSQTTPHGSVQHVDVYKKTHLTSTYLKSRKMM